MAIRVLIVNRQLAFSVALKQSLERTGAFEVHPFTTADAAAEYLQAHPQDVVLLDFNSVAPNGAAVVDALRRLQPGIAIVVSPKQSAETMRSLALQENIDPPFTTRDVIPLLNRAVEAMRYSEDEQSEPEPGRPGEIGDRELRPYMVSTDIFQQGQDAPPSEKSQKGSQFRRPGEIDPSELEPRTDVFKESEAEPKQAPPSRRIGEYPTSELPSPTTDTLHAEWESDDVVSQPPQERTKLPPALDESDPRPPARYVVREFPKVSGEDENKEISEQDLLNYAFNQDEANRAAAEREAQQPRQAAEYRVTDTDSDEADDESAAAMWEPLTRAEQAPVEEEEDEAISFDFDFDEEEEESGSDTPVRLPFDDVGPVAEWLDEAIQTEDEVPNKAAESPRTVTDFLKARTSELEMLEVAEQNRSDDERDWDFPEDDILAADSWPEGDEEPPRDPEQVALSRKPTNPLPESVRSKLANDELLAQQFEVDSLVDDMADEGQAALPAFEQYQAPFDSEIEDDSFEPPMSPDDIIASWESPDLPESESPHSTSETRMLDADDGMDGVARLEQIAEEIRHTRSTAKLQPQPQSQPEELPDEPQDQIFQKLAAEEPPMPTEMDGDTSGTVGDLYAGVHDPAFQNVLQILRGEEDAANEVREPEAVLSDTPSEGPVITQSEIEEIFTSFSRRDRPRDEYSFDDIPPTGESAFPAHLILETALDESTPADSFSLEQLIASIERQLGQQKPGVRPLPSWQEDQNALRGDLYVREPDFLAGVIADVDSLPHLEDEDEFGDATTYAGEAVEPTPNAETELLRPENYPTSLPEMDWILEPPVTEDDTNDGTRPIEAVEAPQPQPDDQLLRIEDEEPEFNTEFERLAAFNLETDEEREATPSMGLPAIQDPYIAQVALSLTQISLEELAAAVLSQENEVIAHAGRMGRNDIEEVRRTINDQWDTGSEQANIRFITLASSGKDYLLYSRRTVNDLTLSLLFPGSTPMRDIRKQGKRLIEALMSVPEPEVYDDAEADGESMFMAAAESDVRSVYTYIWLLRDPDLHLNEMVASAIESGLRVQLEERNWQILDLQVRDECVYLLADVPGEMPPYEVIRDLKRRSAEIARKQNAIFGRHDVWADSYLIVTPGRELGEDEIQEFISFERIS
ncbi:MAG: transposase [Anaerolineae bacterium]|nr:transposase [Anaerolineae bacterium]